MQPQTGSQQLEAARAAVADQRGVAAGDVELEVLRAPEVPGLIVFRTRLRSGGGRRGSFNVGVVNAGEGEGGLELDPRAAATRVLRAWRYDSSRPAPASAVARVVGFLQGGGTTPTETLLEASAIAALPASWQHLVFLPREAIEDGLPALEYWVSGSFVEDTEPPLWRVRVVVPPDGPVRFSVSSISSLLQEG